MHRRLLVKIKLVVGCTDEHAYRLLLTELRGASTPEGGDQSHSPCWRKAAGLLVGAAPFG